METKWEIEIVYRRWIDGRLQSRYKFYANEQTHGYTDKLDLTKEDLLRLDDILDDIETSLRLTVPKEEDKQCTT